MYRRRHQRGQEARVEPELAIEMDVLRALRRGAEPGMADAPSIKSVADRTDERLADTAVPQIGMHRQGTEKLNAAPPCREVGADHLAVEFGSEARDMLGAEPAVNIITVGPECRRIGRTKARSESAAADFRFVSPRADRFRSSVGSLRS